MITVYGRPGCAISQMIRRWLDRRGIPYQYVDVERNPQARSRLAWLTGGAYAARPSSSAATSWCNRRSRSWNGR